MLPHLCISTDYVVLAFHLNGAGLGPKITRFLVESDFHAYGQFVELGIDHAVFMKIDLATVCRLDFAVTLVPEQLEYAAMGLDVMSLHMLLTAPGVIFEFASGVIEGIADGDIDVLMRVMQIMCLTDDNFVVGYGDVDADMIKVSLMVMMVLSFDDDATAHYLVAELIQLSSLLTDVGLHGFGRFHIPEREL